MSAYGAMALRANSNSFLSSFFYFQISPDKSEKPVSQEKNPEYYSDILRDVLINRQKKQ